MEEKGGSGIWSKPGLEGLREFTPEPSPRTWIRGLHGPSSDARGGDGNGVVGVSQSVLERRKSNKTKTTFEEDRVFKI